MNTLSLIREFLSQKRFAMIGVSRNSKDFSRTLFGDLMTRGFEVVPVNPHADDISRIKPFANIRDVSPPVTSSLLMIPPLFLQHVLQDCVEAGVTLVWIYGIMSSKSVDDRVLKFCNDRGIRVIAGLCPYMFLPDAATFHRLHGWAWKMVGIYPK